MTSRIEGYPRCVPQRPRRAVLYGVAAGGAVAEAVGLRAAGLVSVLPLAPQLTAPAPIGAFHDDRWVLTFGTDWWTLLLEALAAVVVRGALSAVLVRAAWPQDRPLPGWRALWGRSTVGAAACLVVMSPWAALAFAGGVVSLSWPILAGGGGAAVVGMLLVAHVPATERWWVRWPPWRAMVWLLVAWLLLTAAAVGIDEVPAWAGVVVAGVAGAVDAWCWERLVAASLQPARVQWGRLAAALSPLRLALGVAVPVVVASLLVTRAVPNLTPAHPGSQAPPRHGQRTVLLVGGFDSLWNGRHPSISFPGFYDTQFSYRGLGRHGRPLPYSSGDTTAALPVLARRLQLQVARLHRLSGRRIDVVAVSEGVLVLRQYLAGHPHPPIGTIVLSSPLPRPSRVFFPPPGHSGRGWAGGWEARLLLDLVHAEDTSSDLDVDMPMLRSLVDEAPLFRQRSLCPVPGVKVVALLPLTAAVAAPPGPLAGVPDGVVPAVHATLLDTGAVQHTVDRVLHGHPMPRHLGWGTLFQVVRYSSSAWETPPVPLGAVAAWRHDRGNVHGDAAFGSYGCPATNAPAATVPTHRG